MYTRLRKYILTFGWFFTNIFLSFSQDISFNHLTTDNGLSQVSAMSIYEDERGFIWIGTRDGLNFYNGHSIKTFKLEKNNPNSLFSNSILKVEGNRHNKIFLHCSDGITEYDFKKEKFTTLLQANVSTIYFNKYLYVCIGNEIFISDEKNGGFKRYLKLPDNRVRITSLYLYGNTLWIGTNIQGLYLYKNNRTLTHLLRKGNVTNIYMDSAGKFWVGTWEYGLFRFNGYKVTNFRNEAGNPKSIGSDFVRACCEDNQGNIWVGTFNGLCKYDQGKNEFTTYIANGQPSGLTHSSIWCILKDHQGTLWMGTYFGGINYFNPEYEIYTLYKSSGIESRGLSSPIVGKMQEDKNHNLWICTEGGGLNMYNRTTGKFTWYRHNKNKNSISHNNIKAIYYDAGKDLIWIGTHLGGLNKFDLRKNHFTQYHFVENDSTSLPSDIVRDIVPYKDQLVIAAEGGVCLFDPNTGKCRKLFKDEHLIQQVADLMFDYQGTLWLATNQGVFSYRFDTDKLGVYKHNNLNSRSLSNNNVNSIFQDSRHNLWFCTSGSGLDLYRYKTDDFEHYDALNNGLSSDCVYQACESSPGYLLVINNQGFSRFDCSRKIFYNYNVENGFPLTAINENALYLTHDGEVFLGGVQGLISFKMKDLNFTLKSFKLMLDHLFVNGSEAKVGDETGILKSSLCSSSSIKLKSKYHIFSIEFSASNFIPANKCEIEYKLEGFSNSWTSTRGQQSITYTNLNPGDYTLVIRAKDAKGKTVAESRLDIEILPPFYRTNLAYLLYLLLIGAIIYYSFRINSNRIKLQESLKYEQKHIQDVEKLNQAKLNFFTNISHEFRTPLTVIIGQMEMLLHAQSFVPSVYKKILSVYKNSIHLNDLITELLDFRKQEEGLMKIKVSEHNIVNFLNENYLLFLEYAKSRQIELRFIKETECLNVWYDSRQMQKVMSNLLSNAFKHTQSKDRITISIKKVNDCAEIGVVDTGSGIAAEDIGKIFDSFYQSEASEVLGTGIGLTLTKGIVELHHGTITVSSELNNGTVFTIKLPLGKNHFDASEFCEHESEPVKPNLEIIKPEYEFNFIQNNEVNKSKEKKILIVEDNKSLLDMLVDVFDPLYEVITAVDGEEALEKVKTEMPSIVLSDVLMPKMSGTELCKSIKNDIATCHIPVVLLTARTSIEHNLEGLQIGADDYITKPFNTNILVLRCNNLVNSRIILLEKFSRQPQVTPQMLATNVLDKDLLDKIVEIIERHLDDIKFNINVFAREMGMSRTNLFAKIKNITGQTPNDFISSVRLKRAAIALRNNPELNITEISDQFGFSSSRYFCKCFKDQYHVSPMSYRNGRTSDEKDEKKEEGIKGGQA